VFDGQVGLHQNYIRDFDPATGRYVESDPVGLRGGLDTYAYVLDNPLTWSDPLGLAPWDWDGVGDTSVCEYYDNQARATKCPYYSQAGKACRGRRSDINFLLRIGIAQAWLAHRTTASESQIYDAIRRGLVRYDQYTRQSSSVGCGGDCPRGDWIDLYHNIVFESAGISPFFYGGNIIPQGIGPNFVPYDSHGNSSLDPRRWFLD
jgi:RHS repeat-associated protein